MFSKSAICLLAIFYCFYLQDHVSIVIKENKEKLVKGLCYFEKPRYYKAE